MAETFKFTHPAETIEFLAAVASDTVGVIVYEPTDVERKVVEELALLGLIVRLSARLSGSRLYAITTQGRSVLMGVRLAEATR